MRNWSWSNFPVFKRFIDRHAPQAVLQIYVGRMYGYRSMMTFAPTIVKSRIRSARFTTQFEWVGLVQNWVKSFGERVLRKVVTRSMGGGIDYEYGTLLRDSDRIIVLAEPHRNVLLQEHRAAGEKLILVPPGPLITLCPQGGEAARSRGRSLLDVRPDEFLFVNYGYALPGKGLDTLIKAFRIVAARHPNVRLAQVGGSGEQSLLSPTKTLSAADREFPDQIRGLPERLGIAPRVIWAGPFSTGDERASLCLRAADVCVLPFDYGVTMNRSSFAAVAAHGLPTITTDGQSLEPQFRDRENIYLCPPRNIELLAAAMETLLGDSQLRARLAEGVRSLAGEWFSWDRVMDLTERAFSEAP
jgi:glycosyltransferase involved in cell wall biosynthesis